jgi:hypothetical protein
MLLSVSVGLTGVGRGQALRNLLKRPENEKVYLLLPVRALLMARAVRRAVHLTQIAGTGGLPGFKRHSAFP